MPKVFSGPAKICYSIASLGQLYSVAIPNYAGVCSPSPKDSANFKVTFSSSTISILIVPFHSLLRVSVCFYICAAHSNNLQPCRLKSSICDNKSSTDMSRWAERQFLQKHFVIFLPCNFLFSPTVFLSRSLSHMQHLTAFSTTTPTLLCMSRSQDYHRGTYPG